ncbi:MAG: alkaline phosphatase family protein [Bacteroidia bacterium]|nr:alkaline phosphatase family protein [Bacteroidia bacterium]NND25863.1 alkaline phosphatase family protein [Flavobacteriaceae bacterium]MBT8279825.1 alkaline phosphatase family protein [Bacteroidia bacterium]NNK59663.1 alkaline phosphatase family protein [Flavobacteriaceae bacterium]NNL32515.1 alkaline phosphatase family protein [Flavobacteriaceae bacterium]
MKKFIILFSLALFYFSCQAQNSISPQLDAELQINTQQKPKLIVGIVVDQMRYDYLTRFANKFGDGGFKRLIGEGFNCSNNHFNYVPTYTGPGHASIYTGTTPKYHGIISNNWYDKVTKKSVYCSGDPEAFSLGTKTNMGRMSPHRMVSTTLSDENKLFTQMRGKTIGISLKDRGAILPAGHTADAAYWFAGGDEGHWITSTYYMKKLPKWVEKFNTSNAIEKYLQEWNTLYDIEDYSESGPDLNDFEGGFNGKDTATFPYDLMALSPENGGYDILKTTPFGNNLVTDFAIAALDQEALGTDNYTDVLAISYSSTDYIGHNFGVNSKEIEDTYIRLDKDIERLLLVLDNHVGKGQYTIFLTADHGAVNVPSYLQSIKIPAGYVNNTMARQNLNLFLTKFYGTADIVDNVSNNQIFLNRLKLAELKLDLETVQETIVNEIITYKNVYKAFSATTMSRSEYTSGIELLLQNGFNQKRSGDVLYVHSPAVISYGRTGSTHGSGLNYDTHVPLIFFGQGIRQGNTNKRTNITDIAPTMSALLGIGFPNASTGKVLDYILR